MKKAGGIEPIYCC